MNKQVIQARPDIEYAPVRTGQVGDIARRLGLVERLYANAGVRRSLVLVVLALIWEVYARYLGNSLMFPTFSETAVAMAQDLASGVLPLAVASSLKVLLISYALAIALAAVLTTLAVSTRLGTDVLATLTAMFNPLPAIAILPLAMLWFGLGIQSLMLVIVHSVLWAVSLNTYSGFQSVSQTQRMAGRNYGLRGLGLVLRILIPAAVPSILAGLKIGWAFAWRTLIAAELVFGVSGNSGGLGWYVFQHRNALETPNVFAGLLMVIVIGLVVEGLVFRSIEVLTVRRWGMQG
ncbi:MULTISPECIES: ABC transporter permease [Pseudomonas]|uniref:ABC transporter permease n=1 Tax=Pseudomonas TaxID=286 RepID=UPI000F566947|nr:MULTISPECIES: ABC transporter permease [Pseudomonas]AZF15555.1 Taurine transport system permease protein TauC [Pseudomonas sp. R3-18-08]AZF26198.1 Taurine transport system permease protein TauC [Pseudomonas sp. R2-60-08W]AZF31564.1 Taurine transport system permease protein TauC [Pseudomonas sp. R4-35-07]AZF36840.1 Taurine transport system permease protein TauC [Pseudomonas sp. R4-39-08]AZF52507.1 Taurine transport system permease protein TauC [Pseudomonas sp. R4-34-07]